MDDTFTTTRPLTGQVGEALLDQDQALERFAAQLVETLDGGEGWIEHTPDGFIWFAGRLATRVTGSADRRPSPLNAEIELVRGISAPSPQLLRRINDLNAHAVGWCVWFDNRTGSVRSTMRCNIEQQSWWWCWQLLLQLPHHATAADAVADELADLGNGLVAVVPHPRRGLRPNVDGWILGTRLGINEPVAALGVFSTLCDSYQLNHALPMLEPSLEFSTTPSGDVTAFTSDRVLFENTAAWHPELGWGRRFVTRSVAGIDGVPDSEQLAVIAAAVIGGACGRR